MRLRNRICAIALLATLAALTSAMPAFAAWGNSTYTDWDIVKLYAGNTGSSNPNSPHGGYSSTTTKCNVCHAVHSAPVGSEALLNDTKANACTYCHVSLTGAGYTQVYGSDTANYLTDTVYNHSSEGGASCLACHQVHGATNQMTLNEYLSQKILKGAKVQQDGSPYDGDIALAPQPLATDNADVALTKWCTVCHNGAYGYSYYSVDPLDNDTHVLTPITGGRNVAWLDSQYCSRCHSAGKETLAPSSSMSWPHYTQGAGRFLVTGSGSGDAAPVGVGTATRDDGVCLRCHRDGTGASNGVGLSF